MTERRRAEDLRAYEDSDGSVMAIYARGELCWYGSPGEVVWDLFNMLGIPLVEDAYDNFLLGQSASEVSRGESEPAQTEDEIIAWRDGEAERDRQADELEQRARDMLAEARRLRRNTGR